MTFRARLSLFALESRENPSTPTVDPFVLPAPAPTEPVATAPSDPASIIEAAVIAGATVAPTTPPAPPPDTTSTLYQLP